MLRLCLIAFLSSSLTLLSGFFFGLSFSWFQERCELDTLLECAQTLMVDVGTQVFSQWPAALLMVGKALAIQKPPIKHVSLTGVKHRGQVRIPYITFGVLCELCWCLASSLTAYGRH